jgi:hypothetical protein
MTYVYSLATGQQISLHNQASQTIITVTSSQPGQQQQSSSSLQTGPWTAPPQVSQTSSGILIKIQSVQGEQYIQVQGNPIQVGTPAIDELEISELASMQPMQPMQPIQPIQPMKMGNMSMSLNPMEMRMGNMELRMESQPNSTTKKFCSQCGTSVKPDDQFCTNCGSRL